MCVSMGTSHVSCVSQRSPSHFLAPPVYSGPAVDMRAQVGDWLDSILLPVCQTGCPWPDAGSGGGLCGSPVNVCDEMEVRGCFGWR